MPYHTIDSMNCARKRCCNTSPVYDKKLLFLLSLYMIVGLKSAKESRRNDETLADFGKLRNQWFLNKVTHKAWFGSICDTTVVIRIPKKPTI